LASSNGLQTNSSLFPRRLADDQAEPVIQHPYSCTTQMPSLRVNRRF